MPLLLRTRFQSSNRNFGVSKTINAGREPGHLTLQNIAGMGICSITYTDTLVDFTL